MKYATFRYDTAEVENGKNKKKILLFREHSSLVFTSDISTSKITKDKFSSEVYEDKAKRIFF